MPENFNNNNRNNRKFTIIEHLSDIGIRVYAGSLEELFENAALGMFSIMCDLKTVKLVEKRRIEIKESSLKSVKIGLEDLLVIWLEKLLYTYEVKKMLFSKFYIIRLINTDFRKLIEAEAYGEKIDFKRHELIIAVKAPTYHMLELKTVSDKKLGYSWFAQVIFDV